MEIRGKLNKTSVIDRTKANKYPAYVKVFNLVKGDKYLFSG